MPSDQLLILRPPPPPSWRVASVGSALCSVPWADLGSGLGLSLLAPLRALSICHYICSSMYVWTYVRMNVCMYVGMNECVYTDMWLAARSAADIIIMITIMILFLPLFPFISSQHYIKGEKCLRTGKPNKQWVIASVCRWKLHALYSTSRSSYPISLAIFQSCKQF